VVDDEPEVGELLASLLRRRGWEAEFVTSAASALERIRTTAFHAILTDIRMPEMRGDELWRLLSLERPDLAKRTVLITGDHGAPETADLVESAGIPCLTKPFRPDELDEILATLEERPA
jgi:CheY-like chemotaxis protein